MISNKLIDASFEQVFGHLRDALRISLPPFLIALVVAFGGNWPTVQRIIAQDGANVQVGGAGIALLFLGVAALVFAGFWVAVNWHRFSLGDPDGSGLVKRTLFYAGVSILISFALLILMLVPTLILSVIVGESVNINIGSFSESLARGWFHVGLNAVATFAFAYFLMRWSPWLVSLALGRKAGPSFPRSFPLRGQIVHIAILYTAATFVWSFLGFAGLPWWFELGLDLIFMWIAFMLSIAVLTEIYRATEPDLEATV